MIRDYDTYRSLTKEREREKLTMLPSKATTAPSQITASVPPIWEQRQTDRYGPSPNDCPSSRDAARMPLAPPLLWRGALLIIAVILGDWKKPMPQSIRRHAQSDGHQPYATSMPNRREIKNELNSWRPSPMARSSIALP
jgi:hypothetical protein